MKLSKLLIIGAVFVSVMYNSYANETTIDCSTPEEKKQCKILKVLEKTPSIGFNASRSDIRLKENIQPLQDSLEKINRINGYSYQWRSNEDSEYGVIAQEVQAEFPRLVKDDEQGYLRVDYRGLMPVLLESIKSLKARIDRKSVV